MKIDWTKKLTSRKFWVAIIAMVTGILTAFGKSNEETAQIAGIIMACATAVAYIIGEGLTDAAAVDKTECEGAKTDDK